MHAGQYVKWFGYRSPLEKTISIWDTLYYVIYLTEIWQIWPLRTWNSDRFWILTNFPLHPTIDLFASPYLTSLQCSVYTALDNLSILALTFTETKEPPFLCNQYLHFYFSANHYSEPHYIKTFMLSISMALMWMCGFYGLDSFY